jgi:hypothetical protein
MNPPVIVQRLVLAAATHNSPINWVDFWRWLLAIATLLGGLTAAQQIIKSVRRRREEAALTKLLGAIADTTDADAARAELDRVLQALDTSKRALEEDVPRQAHIMFLQNRRQALIDGISSDYRELERTSQELETLSEPSPAIADLPASVRNAIETLVHSNERSRRRENRMLRLLIGILVITLLSPVSPSAWVYEYFEVISNGSDHTQGTVWGATLLGGLVACGALYWPGHWLSIRLTGWRRHLTTGVICLLAAVAIAGFGFLLQVSLDQVYSSEDLTTGTPFPTVTRLTEGPDGEIQLCAFFVTLAIGVAGAVLLPPTIRGLRVRRRELLARPSRNGRLPRQAEGEVPVPRSR